MEKTLFQKKYEDTEESFKAFQSTKEIVSVVDYLKRINVNEEEAELYEGVKQVLLYDLNNAIFQIENGKDWEYEPFRCVTGEFAIPDWQNELFESDILEEVEHRLFDNAIEDFY